MTTNEFIVDFNGGGYDDQYKIFKIFGKPENFLKYLHKQGKLSEINLSRLNYEFEFNINKLFLTILQLIGPDYFLKYLWNVEKVGDDYYVKLGGLSEFWVLFSNYRNSNEERIVEGVFGSDWFEMFDVYNYTNIYDEIVLNLDDENRNKLRENILSICGDEVFTYDDFSKNAQHIFDDEDEFIVQDNIDNIMSNGKMFNTVINLYVLEDLKHNLLNLYSNAYNEAWVDETYSLIWDSLSTYFDKDSITWYDNGGSVLIKIKFFKTILSDYFNCHITMENDDSIDDEGSFLTLMNSLFDACVDRPSFNTRDYPDSDKVSEYLNDAFGDYVN